MADQTEEFKSFCADQVQRLSQFRQFGFLDTAARRDYRKWLEAKCATREEVQRIVDQAVLLEDFPQLADLNRLWLESNPPRATAHSGCAYCHGSGFEIVELRGCSGALRCRCGGVPVADPNLSYVSPGA